MSREWAPMFMIPGKVVQVVHRITGPDLLEEERLRQYRAAMKQWEKQGYIPLNNKDMVMFSVDCTKAGE